MYIQDREIESDASTTKSDHILTIERGCTLKLIIFCVYLQLQPSKYIIDICTLTVWHEHYLCILIYNMYVVI